MRNNTLRRSNVSKERAMALDELLPKKSTNYDSSPGVYVRSEHDRELDVLWQGFKVNHREDRSPGFYLGAGFITGAICTILVALVINIGVPSKDNLSDLYLWKKANIKPTVNVVPSTQAGTVSSDKTTEYKVKSGDTLGAIAYKFYGTDSPDKIKKIQILNKMKTPDDLQIDQNLVIPMED